MQKLIKASINTYNYAKKYLAAFCMVAAMCNNTFN